MKSHKQDETQTRIAVLENTQAHIVTTLYDIKTQISYLSQETKNEIRELKNKIDETEKDIKSELREFRKEVNEKFNQLEIKTYRVENRAYQILSLMVSTIIMTVFAKIFHFI